MSSITLTPSQVSLIAETARSWVGTPYAHLGRLKGHACDCAGLVIKVANELGITDFDTREYGRDPHPERMRSTLLRHMYELEFDRAYAKRAQVPPGIGAGDVVHIRWRNHPRHLGILVPRESGGLNLIHAFQGAGKVVEHHYDKLWLSLTLAGYRYKWQV